MLESFIGGFQSYSFLRLQNWNFREDLCANSPKLTWLHYKLERAAEIKPMILADTKRYEGFRQVHDIHKYFDEIKC